MVKNVLLVAFGGAVGSVLRYLSSVLVNRVNTTVFPFATLTINVIGCFLIGILVGYLQKNEAVDSDLKYLLITGFCGGYTTFSAFGLENVSLLQSGHNALAFIYIASSILIGIAAVWAGMSLSLRF